MSLSEIILYFAGHLMSLFQASKNQLLIFATENDNKYFMGIDMSIEGMRSQKFSVAIFIFLIMALMMFTFIIYLYWPKEKFKNIKTGEKIMFGSMIVAVILALIMGYVQLIEGYLL